MLALPRSIYGSPLPQRQFVLSIFLSNLRTSCPWLPRRLCCSTRLIVCTGLKKKRRIRLFFFLHHDNVRPHTTMVVQAYLERKNIEVLPHPLYSPDLVPCDYWQFPMLKKAIQGQHIKSCDKVVNAAYTFFNFLSQEDNQHQVDREDGEVYEARRPILRESAPCW